MRTLDHLRSHPLGEFPRLILWVVVAAAVLPTKADPDLWGTLRFGLDFLDSPTFSTSDPYSFTSDVPWINHTWLAQILMASAYRLGGVVGLVALKASLVGATLWLVAGAFRGAAYLVAEAAVGFLLIAILPLIGTVRGQLWTLFCLAILLRMVLSPKPQVMAFAPLLFAVWVNLHVGWMVGIGVLACWAIGVSLNGRGSWFRAIVITGAAVLATLLNPYGWKMWRFSAGVSHFSRDISEWEPMWRASLLHQVAFVSTVVLVALVWARLRPRISLDRLAAISGLAYASLNAVKFNSLFVLTSVLFMAPAIVSRFPRTDANFPRAEANPNHLRHKLRILNATLLTLLLGFTTLNAWPTVRCLASGEWQPDATAARALRDAKATGRIAVTFDWGEYVIWHLGPGLRVSFDPRFDLVYSPQAIAQQFAIGSGSPAGLQFLARERPEYVWFRQASSRLKAWLPANGYRIDIDTPASFVAVRDDLAPLRNPGPQVFGCFPSP